MLMPRISQEISMSHPDAISIETLAACQGRTLRPLIIDVRRAERYDEADLVIPGAIRRDPADVGQWWEALELARPIVVYCVHGHEVGRNTAAYLRDRGYPASFLEDGIEGWIAAGKPVAPKPPAPSVWVTRERPKIDRIACPWLVRRFIDPDARFLYVPPTEVLKVAAETGATPYDVPGVEFTHVGEHCSFDRFIEKFKLGGAALAKLADIVRGADTGRLDLAAPAAGLFAISLGLSAMIADDQQVLRYGMVVYDALYAWLAGLQTETHGWPPAAAA
jgi:rhodanese-related sulfurtransferase